MGCEYCGNCVLFKNGTCEYPEFCLRKFKIDKFLDLGLISPAQREDKTLVLDSNNCDLEAYTYLNNLRKNILDFVFNGDNLYIYSQQTGNGKTEWSLKLLKSYILKIWHKSSITCKVLFISVPRYLLSIKDAISNNNEYAQHIKENVLSADIVVWDDIATKGMTEFETENVLSIVDARINMGKSNIFTSNITPQELQIYVGDRLGSRILGTSKLIKFVGQDKRILGKANYDSTSSN